jgi:hypothetical protein
MFLRAGARHELPTPAPPDLLHGEDVVDPCALHEPPFDGRLTKIKIVLHPANPPGDAGPALELLLPERFPEGFGSPFGHLLPMSLGVYSTAPDSD